MENETEKKRRGNPALVKGVVLNPLGRPKTINKERKTTRQKKQEELQRIARKLDPHVARCVATIMELMNNPDTSPSIRANCAFGVIKNAVEIHKYVANIADDESIEAEVDLQDDRPTLSLKVINS